VFYRHLTTTPEPVEAYIDAIPAEQDARSRYFWARRRMSEEIALVELSDDAVVRFASEQLNLPDCCYLFFHLGVKIGVLCVAGDRTSLRPAMGPTSEGDLRALHDAYARELPPLEVLAEDLGAKEAEAALDRLLEGYEEHLGRYFEQFLDMFEGKQLKIFPRMLMNAAPLHAMKVRGKRLLEYCDVSYGQSLPLFTQLHREERGGTENLTFVHGEGVPLYEGMLRELWDDYGDRLTLLRQPGYDALAGAMTTEASGDLSSPATASTFRRTRWPACSGAASQAASRSWIC
jgi:hypothetical protein